VIFCFPAIDIPHELRNISGTSKCKIKSYPIQNNRKIQKVLINANLGSDPCFEERIKRVRICIVLKVMAGQMALLLVMQIQVFNATL
jgi:hypothetical protein